MANITKKAPAIVHNLPVGLVLNQSLWERDIYKDEKGVEGAPKYKVRMAFVPADVRGPDTIEDKIADAFAAEFGEQAAADYLDGKRGFRDPFRDGNLQAADREAKGKEADAIKGKIVITADTAFNKFREKGPGGISVYKPDATAYSAMEKEEVYPGCLGIAAVTINVWVDGPTRDKCAKFYLVAFQKTHDGKRLITQSDNSTLFKPVVASPGAAGTPEAGVRRRRAG